MGEGGLNAWLVVAIVALGIATLFVSARRAVTVCVLSVERGRVRVRRGDLTPRILQDLRDVATRPEVLRGEIRITRSSGRAQVALRGSFTDAQAQQVRNVVGSVPLAMLASARASRGL